MRKFGNARCFEVRSFLNSTSNVVMILKNAYSFVQGLLLKCNLWMVDISPICVKIGGVSVVEYKLSVAIINLTSPQVQESLESCVNLV